MYQITASPDSILRDDGACIPCSTDNADYLVYLQWLADGGVPTPAPVAAPAVPPIVTRFQACAALLGAGLLDQVDAIMADPSTPRIASLAWSTAQEFRRASPLVASLGSLLGLDDAALDALFINAAGIEA